MAEEYRKGDYVSYSCNGVCLVEDVRVDAPTGKGEPKTFYILKPVADREQIEKLCAEAREHHFASVCVNTTMVHLAAELLKDSGVNVCLLISVIICQNFLYFNRRV